MNESKAYAPSEAENELTISATTVENVLWGKHCNKCSALTFVLPDREIAFVNLLTIHRTKTDCDTATAVNEGYG